jgi:hypothetical protein
MIFVDDLFVMEARGAQAHAVGAKNGHRWCHCWSDGSLEDLDRFAVSIGLRTHWRDGDHYDLTPSRRAAAIRAGAVEAPTGSEAERAWAARRRGGRKLRCRACGFVTWVPAGGEPPLICPFYARHPRPVLQPPSGPAVTWPDRPAAGPQGATAGPPAAQSPPDGEGRGGGGEPSPRPLVF